MPIPDELKRYDHIWDQQIIRAPDSTRKYMIKSGDTLDIIAKQELGDPSMAALIYHHNKNIGELNHPDKLYANTEIEIPIYDDLT